MLWLPCCFVRLPTNCSCFSFWSSGQLQRFTPRPDPNSKAPGSVEPSPPTNPAGRPDVKVSSRFNPKIPASLAGVVPKSNGNTLTLYLKKPTRKSMSNVGEKMWWYPDEKLWLMTSDTPPRLTSSEPPPVPNDVGPSRRKSPRLNRPNAFKVSEIRPSMRTLNEF